VGRASCSLRICVCFFVVVFNKKKKCLQCSLLRVSLHIYYCTTNCATMGSSENGRVPSRSLQRESSLFLLRFYVLSAGNREHGWRWRMPIAIVIAARWSERSIEPKQSPVRLSLCGRPRRHDDCRSRTVSRQRVGTLRMFRELAKRDVVNKIQVSTVMVSRPRSLPNARPLCSTIQRERSGYGAKRWATEEYIPR
jgi:hypothetical protein